ncbi:DUF2513 domain-containing protein [Latilactobacillus sakei]|uniref:DUF2513 domain-containing protein n=1 Tax=Latilactobacillus sakei TaxID=1599 RepID=UPI0015F62874|nr:DUF2513 domain-containing protein [Latilactobacillus sakei]MCP8851784.1 DUF2513 domain-containing protein [Latilactobacillus sakei]QMU86154.1 DUF2513 domain-containing protein [Latilactobacillus sakei]
MKQNIDCIRDILLTVEKDVPLDGHIDLKNLTLPNSYDRDDIVYSLKLLKEANYLNVTLTGASNTYYLVWIGNMTYDGHQFLDSIRNANVWQSTKDKIANFGSDLSLSLISQVAMSVIKSQLNL